MLEAALFGAIAQSALLVGALLVWKFPGLRRPKIVGALMAARGLEEAGHALLRALCRYRQNRV